MIERFGNILRFPTTNTESLLREQAEREAQNYGPKINYDAPGIANQVKQLLLSLSKPESKIALGDMQQDLHEEWDERRLVQPMYIQAITSSMHQGKNTIFLVTYFGVLSDIVFQPIPVNWDEVWNTDTDVDEEMTGDFGPSFQLIHAKHKEFEQWATGEDLPAVEIPFARVVGMYEATH